MMAITWFILVFSILAIAVELVEMPKKEDELYKRVRSFLNVIVWILILLQSYTIIGR